MQQNQNPAFDDHTSVNIINSTDQEKINNNNNKMIPLFSLRVRMTCLVADTNLEKSVLCSATEDR